MNTALGSSPATYPLEEAAIGTHASHCLDALRVDATMGSSALASGRAVPEFALLSD
jgi:hypothetical protein